MRPFVHQSIAWAVALAVTAALTAAGVFARGDLHPNWQSVSGAARGISIITIASTVGGVAITGITRFFDWVGWGREPQQEPVRNPIVRAAIAPVLIFGAVYFLLWVLPPSWR
jgi:hypothetical protein